VNEQRLIASFMELVQIDSETKYEATIAHVLTEKLQNLGFTVTCDDVGKKIGHQAGNLLATLQPTSNQLDVPTLLFTCHMDTVTPGKGIKPQHDEDGYIRSDGTTILGSDDKAGIAAFLEAIETIQTKQLPHGKLYFFISIGEENGLLGSSTLEVGAINADYGYALDSNGRVGDIVVAAPSTAKMSIAIYGKKAHAGVNPEDGISAIEVASHAIANMPLGRISASTTANIGSIHGGQETNVVCDFVQVKAEARSLVQDELEKQINAMKAAISHTTEQFRTHAEVDVHMSYPAYSIGEDEPVVLVVKRAIQSIGREPKLVQSGGGSDANHLNRIGIPTVNLAIGYEHIHTTKEQIPVIELVKTAELIEAIIVENSQSTRGDFNDNSKSSI
jgi:tripeptide aminopeptidase